MDLYGSQDHEDKDHIVFIITASKFSTKLGMQCSVFVKSLTIFSGWGSNSGEVR